jgi:hypothetical protein
MNKKTKSIAANPNIAEKALQEAVVKALKKHALLGVPAVFVKSNKLVFRMPNGTLKKRLSE